MLNLPALTLEVDYPKQLDQHSNRANAGDQRLAQTPRAHVVRADYPLKQISMVWPASLRVITNFRARMSVSKEICLTH